MPGAGPDGHAGESSDPAATVARVWVPGQLLLPLDTPRPAGAGAALSDRLCALLVRRGRPLEVGQVASQLLRLRRCPEALQRRLVGEIVESDARLAWHGRDLVGLAPPEWATTDVRAATFCVVDLETTGGVPGSSRITEIGAVRVRGGVVEGRFTTLVDPGTAIPQVITAITGIDDAMVAGMPDVGAALQGFVAFAGEDVLVAHNAPFDLRFLNYERRRHDGRYFTQPWLDTLALSRRLLAGRVGRHDLATLAEWADTTVRPCHRALPDAEATAELLVRLLDMLAEAGHETLERAVTFAAPGGSRYAYKLALAEDLPNTPGVYLMRDRGGEVLYVGKARDLRRRVRSYFGPGGRHGRLIGRALEGLERLDHETCDTDLDALLRESALLLSLRPPCNRRGTGSAARYLWMAEHGPPVVRVVAGRPAAGVAAGPVRPGRQLDRAMALLAALYAEEPDPAVVREEVAGLFGDEPAEAAGALAVRLATAARRGRWTADEEGCAAATALLDVLRSVWRLRLAARRRRVICEASHTGDVVLFGVAGGRVAHRMLLRPGDDAAAGVDDLLARLEDWSPRDPLLPSEHLEEALILETRAREAVAASVIIDGGGPAVRHRLLTMVEGMRPAAAVVRAA